MIITNQHRKPNNAVEKHIVTLRQSIFLQTVTQEAHQAYYKLGYIVKHKTQGPNITQEAQIEIITEFIYKRFWQLKNKRPLK